MGDSCSRRKPLEKEEEHQEDQPAEQENDQDDQPEEEENHQEDQPAEEETDQEDQPAQEKKQQKAISPISPWNGPVPAWGSSVQQAATRGQTESCDLPPLAKG